jgi:tetratricopeptide (TPR) repeat protein
MTLKTPVGSLLGKIAGYLEILAKDPRSTVFVSLAESYRQMGLLDDALEVATRGVQVLPSFSPGYSILGRIQAQRGDHEAAAAAFDRALLIDPENLLSLKGLARVRMQQGDRPQALKLLRRAIALKPDDAVAQKMLDALGASATPSEVNLRPQAVAAAAVSPSNDPISTATIAEIYVRQGFLGRAMKVYRDLLQTDPHNDEIRHKLVELKQRIDTQKVSPTPVEAVVPVEPVEPVQEEVPAPAAEVSAESVEDQRNVALSRQLAVLTRWLDSISRRQADVQ